ncbi:MAG: EAL domain-containing protein, partial [Mesorhizobium sp.]
IKIDKSFVWMIQKNPQSAAIIRAIVGLGRGLSMHIIAEGVETLEQLTFLSEEGCNALQGYLIGRPHPIEAYANRSADLKLWRAARVLAVDGGSRRTEPAAQHKQSPPPHRL